jgi:sporulation protein YunB
METPEKKLPKKSRRKKRILLLICVICAALIVLYLVIERSVGNVLASYAESLISSRGAKALNEAIISSLDNSFTYDQLITVTTDNEGRVRMLQANTPNLNALASRTTLLAQENISKIGQTDIRIPLGTLIGGRLLTGRGPLVTLRVEPVGAVSSEFISEFEEAGINQTLHRIKLRLKATMRVVLSTGSTSVTVQAESAVAESIIVGDVPEMFANIPSAEDILNFVPNY